MPKAEFYRIECSEDPGKCSFSNIVSILEPKAQSHSISLRELFRPENAFRVAAVVNDGIVSELIQTLQKAGAKAITLLPVSRFIP